MGITYKDSGVDIDGGNSFVKRIAPIVKSTFSDRVITDLGGFGALFSGSFPKMKHPVLVSGTDGVGTKLKIAQMMDVHDTIGIDAVAMCVNDILTLGAAPLFFLDYLSCGKLRENVMVDIVKGMAEGCRIAGCSLIGGETAEHPGIMAEDDYDIAGFSVGVVDREEIITGDDIGAGDAIIGLESSGIHSNGYSLVRKLLLEIKKYSLDARVADLGETLGKVLLAPTRIYCAEVLKCIEKGIKIKGIAHITGGGLYENIPRIIPDGMCAKISKSAINTPPIFRLIQRDGRIEDREMYTTFNMGIGMIVVVDKNRADNVMEILSKEGCKSGVVGEMIKSGDEAIIIS
ncbi:MAG: phosphoribosylformylglycinamidine cyclo-ligase [Spirochaetes bacterium]|nr:phosphoribosylformylglycinamidine cyclo-ligase [Spirochaetota bacterium]